MPREKGITQLDILRRRQAEIAEQLKAAEAKAQERAKQEEARRRDLLGSIILTHARNEPDSAWTRMLFEIVGQKLTRPADRALFPNLPASSAAVFSRKAAQKSEPDSMPADAEPATASPD